MSTRIAVCPGSYDPVTLGHVDIIQRALSLADEVIVAIGVNPAKTPFMDGPTRKKLIEEAVSDLPGVRVELVHGLISDYCTEVGASSIIKGIRGGADYDHELPMALMNKHLCGVDTVFLSANPQLIHISSSLVRELAGFGRSVEDLVPTQVAQVIAEQVGHE